MLFKKIFLKKNPGKNYFSFFASQGIQNRLFLNSFNQYGSEISLIYFIFLAGREPKIANSTLVPAADHGPTRRSKRWRVRINREFVLTAASSPTHLITCRRLQSLKQTSLSLTFVNVYTGWFKVNVTAITSYHAFSKRRISYWILSHVILYIDVMIKAGAKKKKDIFTHVVVNYSYKVKSILYHIYFLLLEIWKFVEYLHIIIYI